MAPKFVKPVIQSDETWDSYYWWVKRINGLEQARHAELLGGYRSTTARPSDLLPEFLASAAHLSLEELVLKHTMWPLFRAIGYETENVSFRSTDSFLKLNVRGTHREVQYCPECLEDDIRHLGRRVWRRTDQVPGAMVCHLHPDSELRKTSNSYSAFPESKAILVPRSRRSMHSWRANRFIRRYLSICRIFLQRSYAFRRRQFEFGIIQRAYELGYSVSQDDSFPRLSAYIEKVFPKEWLQSILESHNQGTEIANYVDRIFYWSSFCSERMIYPLIVSTLWEDEDEAMRELKACDLKFANRGAGTKVTWLAMQSAFDFRNSQ